MCCRVAAELVSWARLLPLFSPSFHTFVGVSLTFSPQSLPGVMGRSVRSLSRGQEVVTIGRVNN